jgi:ATPase subunit of ABC transporter with duplicated ATPase domains
VSPGQKIGLTGYNGSGKSTLLKLLTGELEPDAGELWMNPRAAIGYLSQMLSELKSDSCPAEAVRSNTGLSMPDARNLLGKMGISGDTQLQPLNTLSWGEKTRVAIACLTHSEYDALILDEPTNHLDMNARDATEEALGAFPGAIIVATHDRYFWTDSATPYGTFTRAICRSTTGTMPPGSRNPKGLGKDVYKGTPTKRPRDWQYNLTWPTLRHVSPQAKTPPRYRISKGSTMQP